METNLIRTKNPADVPPYSGKSSRKAKIPVNQYDLAGRFLASYESIYVASKATGTQYLSIMRCIKGTIKSANHFQWYKA
jgi:hypothetical protein